MGDYKTYYRNGRGKKHDAYITINRENPGDTVYTVTPKGGTTHRIYYNGKNPYVETFTGLDGFQLERDEDFKNYWLRVGKEARMNKNENTRFEEALKALGNYLMKTINASPLKYQQGGEISKELQEELQYALVGYVIATKKQPKDENEINQIAQALLQLKQKDPKQYSQLVQLGYKQMKVKSAKFGSKLDYIKRLKGQCPEGEELTYFKIGGKVNCKCLKKGGKQTLKKKKC